MHMGWTTSPSGGAFPTKPNAPTKPTTQTRMKGVRKIYAPL